MEFDNRHEQKHSWIRQHVQQIASGVTACNLVLAGLGLMVICSTEEPVINTQFTCMQGDPYLTYSAMLTPDTPVLAIIESEGKFGELRYRNLVVSNPRGEIIKTVRLPNRIMGSDAISLTIRGINESGLPVTLASKQVHAINPCIPQT